jgi:hypothetical protein
MRALYSAETWTHRKVDQKYLKGFKTCCWKRMEKIGWPNLVKNYRGLYRVNVERDILHALKERRPAELVTSCVGTAF